MRGIAFVVSILSLPSATFPKTVSMPNVTLSTHFCGTQKLKLQVCAKSRKNLNVSAGRVARPNIQSSSWSENLESWNLNVVRPTTKVEKLSSILSLLIVTKIQKMCCASQKSMSNLNQINQTCELERCPLQHSISKLVRKLKFLNSLFVWRQKLKN